MYDKTNSLSLFFLSYALYRSIETLDPFAVVIILDEGIMASSLVRYSDVGNPMRPPELVVEKKDVIYVNMTMLQKNKGR